MRGVEVYVTGYSPIDPESCSEPSAYHSDVTISRSVHVCSHTCAWGQTGYAIVAMQIKSSLL